MMHCFNREPAIGYKYQYGFSIIELMIAMAIGTFMIAGIISVFLSTSQNYQLQQAIAEVQSKSSYIMRRMRQDLQFGGFRLTSEQMPVRAIRGGANTCINDPNVTILEVYTDNLTGAVSGDIARRNCYFLNPATNILQRNTITGLATANPDVNNTIDVAPNVVAMNYSFAIDLENDADQEINMINNNAYTTYNANTDNISVKTAATASNVPTWQGVKAVRLEFIVGSEIENVVAVAQEIGGNIMPDRRLYQSFVVVVALRNRVQ